MSLLLREKREKTREGRETERREEKRGEEKERRTDRRKREDRQKARKTEKAETPSVCRFKPPPCVRSRRLRVYRENARVSNAFSRYTRRRLERTHGGGLNLHTEGVSACQAAPHHTKQHNTTHTTHHQQRTKHNVHTATSHHTRTTMPKHTRTPHMHIHIHVHTPPSRHTMHNRHLTVILRR